MKWKRVKKGNKNRVKKIGEGAKKRIIKGLEWGHKTAREATAQELERRRRLHVPCVFDDEPFVSRRKLPTNELTFSFESVPATLFESIKAHTDEYEQKLRETQMSFNELQITDNATEPP